MTTRRAPKTPFTAEELRAIQGNLPQLSLPSEPTGADRRREQTAKARAKRSQITEGYRRRAAELRASGLTPGAIALRMSREYGRPDDRPWDSRQVRRWLEKARTV